MPTNLNKTLPFPKPQQSPQEISQLLADYAECTEALAVHAEMLREAVESEKDWTDAWRNAEDALNSASMARFALAQHLSGPARIETPRGKLIKFRTASGG